MAINASTGAITGTLAAGAGARGPFTVRVVVSNGIYSASSTFEWEAVGPVAILAPGVLVHGETDSVSVEVEASTTSTGTLTYAAEGLPVGLVIDSSTGVISGTIELGNADEECFYPVITVSDGTSSSSVTFAWQVSSAIEVTDIADQENTEGDDVELQVEADGGGTLTYSATGLPAGLSIDADTGLISGTILTGAAGIGEYDTVVTVEDGASVTEKGFHWVVTPVSSVTLPTPSHQNNTEGDSVSLSLSATGTGTIRYFAIGLPPGLVVNPTTGVISGTVAVNDAAISPFSVEVIATNGSAFARQRFTWAVSNPISISNLPDQTGTESGTVSLSVSASGGGTKAYTAVGLPPGLKMNPTTGAITGTLAVGVAAEGPYTVLVTVGDSTFSASQPILWAVGGAIAVNSVVNRTNFEGETPSLSIDATYSGSGTLSYSAQGLPPGLSIDPNTGDITGTIASGASVNSVQTPNGIYSVVVTVSDGMSSSRTSFNWNVHNPITITNLGEQQARVGDSVSLQIQASNASSGTLTYGAIGLPAGLSINATTGLISGTIDSTVAGAGQFASTVTVTDGSYSAVLALQWNVNSPELGLAKATIDFFPIALSEVPGQNAKQSGELLNPPLKGSEGVGFEVYRKTDKAGNYFKVSNNGVQFLGLLVFNGKKINFGACELARGAGMNFFLVTYDEKGHFAALRWYNFETIDPKAVKAKIDSVTEKAKTDPEAVAKDLKTWFYKHFLILTKVKGSYLTIYEWRAGDTTETRFDLTTPGKAEKDAYEQKK